MVVLQSRLIATEHELLLGAAIGPALNTSGGGEVFAGDTAIAQMKRTLPDLVAYLGREIEFPHGVLLMTGTGIVPGDDFTLQAGDVVRITIGDHTLENMVE